MNGTDYVAVKRLYDREGKTLATEGQTCERVPTGSLAVLLEKEWIRRAPAPAKAKQPPVAARGEE